MVMNPDESTDFGNEGNACGAKSGAPKAKLHLP
jgi:hypothetical protein